MADEPEVRVEPAPLATPPAPEPAPPRADWRDDRIRVLTAKLHEEKAAREAAEATKVVAPVVPDPALGEAEIERRADVKAQAKAREIAAQTLFNNQCNEVVTKGRKEFPDFDSKISTLRELIIPNDSQSEASYWSTISAAIKTGEAPKLIHLLGSDKNEAARIMGLDAESRAIELTRLASKEVPLIDPADLPKPIETVKNRGTPRVEIDPRDTERSDRLSTAEWMARREAQVERRRSA